MKKKKAYDIINKEKLGDRVMIKKIITLVLSILLPIAAGLCVVWYGVKVRYDPETNTEVAGMFVNNLNKGVITCEGRIQNYRIIENYYYSEEPLLKKDYLSDDGERLFTIEIYRNLCSYQPSAQVERTWKVMFEVFMYNIDYEVVKDYFYLDDMTVIDNAGNPTFKVTFTPTNGKDPFTLTLSNRSNVMIPDYQANPEYANKDTKTRNYLQSMVIREYESSATLSTFSNDANISVSASYVVTNSDSTTTEILPTKPLATDYISDFRHKGEEFSTDDFLPGFRQPSVKDTYKNAGYYKWIFWHYLWWEFLIGFALVGLVTFTYDVVYFTQEKKKAENEQGKKKK